MVLIGADIRRIRVGTADAFPRSGMLPIDPGTRRRIASPSRGVQLAELSVFLLLIVPALAMSLVPSRSPTAVESFPALAMAVIIRDVGLVALIGFFLWRNGEVSLHSLAPIGLSSRGAGTEIAVGILLFLPMTFSAALLDAALRRGGLTGPTSTPPALTPISGPQVLLAVLLVVIVAISEEIMFRGYLILRLRNLSRSVPFAVIGSSLLFAIGHGYEGSAGVVTIGVLGAELALVYLWRGSLIAPIMMHFLQDFVGIVIAPLLGLARVLS